MLTFDLSALDGFQAKLTKMGDILTRTRNERSAQRAVRQALMDTVVAAARADVQNRKYAKHPSPLANAIRVYIRFDPVKENLAAFGVSYKKDKAARHAHLVEYGHGGPHPAPAHPFWAPAVTAQGQAAMDRLTEIVRRRVGDDWENK